MLQRFVRESIAKPGHTLGEIMLSQPRDHAVFLKIGPCCDVKNQVPKILPVPKCKPYIKNNPYKASNYSRNSPHYINSTRLDFRIRSHDGHTGSERSVYTEHNTIHVGRNNCHVTIRTGLISSVDEY